MIFSDRLKSLRAEKEATQLQVAKKVGILTHQQSEYERGIVEPRIEILIALADYFGVSLDYLTGRTDRR